MLTLTRFTVLSLLTSTLVVVNSLIQKQQFFPAVIYIIRSNTSMMVFYNLAFLGVVLFGKFLKRLFFGQLRPSEVEQLYERSWYAVTETCLAMTIFRDEFTIRFVVMFTVLLFVKIFHWLCKDRVEFMEQSPALSKLYHVRMLSLLGVLASCDAYCVRFSWLEFRENGPSMFLLFGFECVLFSTMLLSTSFRYAMNSVDLLSERPWENKSMYIFYLELVVDLLKLLVYLAFFAMILKFYGIPLHIVRDLYITAKSFSKRLHDMLQYRRATANMNQRYPDASLPELAAADNTCIICREEMSAAKKLPCGHVFHLHCLRSWLERQQTCPTCRSPVLVASPSGGGGGGLNRPASTSSSSQAQAQPAGLVDPTRSSSSSSSDPQNPQNQQNHPQNQQPILFYPSGAPILIPPSLSAFLSLQQQQQAHFQNHPPSTSNKQPEPN
eukprot:Sdes_comp19614_c0_seq1m11360